MYASLLLDSSRLLAISATFSLVNLCFLESNSMNVSRSLITDSLAECKFTLEVSNSKLSINMGTRHSIFFKKLCPSITCSFKNALPSLVSVYCLIVLSFFNDSEMKPQQKGIDRSGAWFPFSLCLLVDPFDDCNSGHGFLR
jgi:hypothetical protein